jgi:hypothetical protein
VGKKIAFRQIRNPKHEIRNKFKTAKPKIQNARQGRDRALGDSSRRGVVLVIRISCFGFV